MSDDNRQAGGPADDEAPSALEAGASVPEGEAGGEPLPAAPTADELGGRERPARRPQRRSGEPITTEMAPGVAAQRGRPWAEPEHTRPSEVRAAVEETPPYYLEEAALRRAERQVAALFLVSVFGTLLFIYGYLEISVHRNYGTLSNAVLGSGLMIAMLGVGAGFVVWAKKLVPHEEAVQEREPMHSPEEDELLTEELFLRGAEELGLPRRKFIRRTALLSMGLLPLPFLLMLKDLGPMPRHLFFRSGWKRGVRLVGLDSRQPIKIGDLSIGSMVAVMPEGYSDINDFPLAPVNLIRLPPGVNHPLKGRADWAVDDHVAYSRICSHVGCPVGLYEQQTHHLLCPCHQSTFDVPNGCQVIFGPAGHPLPQLPLMLDKDGYFRARSDFHQPPGPPFWERP